MCLWESLLYIGTKLSTAVWSALLKDVTWLGSQNQSASEKYSNATHKLSHRLQFDFRKLLLLGQRLWHSWQGCGPESLPTFIEQLLTFNFKSYELKRQQQAKRDWEWLIFKSCFKCCKFKFCCHLQSLQIQQKKIRSIGSPSYICCCGRN